MDWYADMGWLFLEWSLWIMTAGGLAVLGAWFFWYRPFGEERKRLQQSIADLRAERDELIARLKVVK